MRDLLTSSSASAAAGFEPPPPIQLLIPSLVELVLDGVGIPIRRSVTHGIPPFAEMPLHPLQLAERKLHLAAALQGTDHPLQDYVHYQYSLAA